MKDIEKQLWENQRTKRTIDEIIQKRDEFEASTPEWDEWNKVKAELLENLKPSTKEVIVYFQESDLDRIPYGLTDAKKLPLIPTYTGRRSELEYNPIQRHPIPYVIVKHKKYYFFILRGQGVGEMRLAGKKGLLGGHVGVEDSDQLSLSKTLLNGLRRELKEEAGITDELIQSIELKGLLKSNEGVDQDHLGVIYEIELLSKEIVSHEKELTGIWLHEKELKEHASTFESWANMIYEKWLKPSK